MAKEDFCFTYYDGDALRDMSHMNRLERGAYNDLVLQQRKFGRMTLEQIKKILGKDFDECWPSVDLVLMMDEEKKYYIEWLENSVIKSKKHSTKQKENVTKRYQQSTKPLPKSNSVIPLEDGYGDEYGNEDKEKLKEYDLWTEQITVGDDHHFEQMFMRESIPPGDHVQFWIMDHRDLLNRYPKMRPPTQDAFRKSCLKHIRENYKKPINGTSKKTDATNARRAAFAEKHSSNTDG